MINIQENLKAILKERNVLHKQVADGLGITPQTLSNWFNRKTDFPFARISQICEVAHISIVDVVTWPEKYVPADRPNPMCEECKRKDEIIDNLQELIRTLRAENKQGKAG